MENADCVDLLKIRGVFGKTGDGMDNSGYYAYRQTFGENQFSGYPHGTSQDYGSSLSKILL